MCHFTIDGEMKDVLLEIQIICTKFKFDDDQFVLQTQASGTLYSGTSKSYPVLSVLYVYISYAYNSLRLFWYFTETTTRWCTSFMSLNPRRKGKNSPLDKYPLGVLFYIHD